MPRNYNAVLDIKIYHIIKTNDQISMKYYHY